jgi:hypothetical protein
MKTAESWMKQTAGRMPPAESWKMMLVGCWKSAVSWMTVGKIVVPSSCWILHTKIIGITVI